MVCELPPDEHHEDGGAREREPEGRGDVEQLGKHPAERGADDKATEDAHGGHAPDSALELGWDRPLADGDRCRAPHECMPEGGWRIGGSLLIWTARQTRTGERRENRLQLLDRAEQGY